jgi:hypothetical protein
MAIPLIIVIVLAVFAIELAIGILIGRWPRRGH